MTKLATSSIFFTPSPSFLAYQRTLQQTKGQNNVHPLFGVQHIPCDNQIRMLLDPIPPRALDAVFLEVFERLEQHRLLAPCRSLAKQLLVALDGTNSFSSNAIHGQNCLTRQLTHGHPLDYHAAITPVIVCPGHSQVIALPPEYSMPQDGQAQQDCERAAAQRWRTNHAEQVAPHGVTFLGDDRSSNQPFCALVLHNRCHFILTCKPDSHPKFYERLACWQATDGRAQHEERRRHGRVTEVTMVRSINDGLLRGGDEALAVNGFDLTVVNAKTGEPL